MPLGSNIFHPGPDLVPIAESSDPLPDTAHKMQGHSWRAEACDPGFVEGLLDASSRSSQQLQDKMSPSRP